jgi:hypothetical protein
MLSSVLHYCTDIQRHILITFPFYFAHSLYVLSHLSFLLSAPHVHEHEMCAVQYLVIDALTLRAIKKSSLQ